MGFRAIVRKTLIDLTGWKRTIMLLAVGLLVPAITAFVWRSELRNAGLAPRMETFVVLKHFIGTSFIWTSGFFLALAVVASAAGAISREANDGTLLTLVSKPISRRQIVLGKFVGIVAYALLMEAAILLVQAVLLWLVLPVEAPTYAALLKALPWILLYSLLVILVFASLSLALSSLVDSQVIVAVLACGAILFLFLFGPILSTWFGVSQGSYEKNHLYMIDGAYQFGNAFAPAMEQALGGEMLPAGELGEIKYFAGIFEGGRAGGTSSSEYYYPGQLASYVAPAVSAVLLLVLAAGCTIVAIVVTERRDVG